MLLKLLNTVNAKITLKKILIFQKNMKTKHLWKVFSFIKVASAVEIFRTPPSDLF